MVVAGAIATIAGVGYSIYAGEEQRKVQKQGLRRQTEAQEQAKGAAARQQRTAEESFRAANRRSPDIASILADEQARPPSTLLTGFGGINPLSLRTGRPSLLGE